MYAITNNRSPADLVEGKSKDTNKDRNPADVAQGSNVEGTKKDRNPAGVVERYNAEGTDEDRNPADVAQGSNVEGSNKGHTMNPRAAEFKPEAEQQQQPQQQPESVKCKQLLQNESVRFNDAQHGQERSTMNPDAEEFVPAAGGDATAATAIPSEGNPAEYLPDQPVHQQRHADRKKTNGGQTMTRDTPGSVNDARHPRLQHWTTRENVRPRRSHPTNVLSTIFFEIQNQHRAQTMF